MSGAGDSPGREPAMIAGDGEQAQGHRGAGGSTSRDGHRSAHTPENDSLTASTRDAPPEAGAPGNMWGSPPKPVRLPCENGDVLQWLLAPQDEKVFLDEVWERKALHIPHQDAHYFKDVMTLEDLEDVLLNTVEDEEFGETLTFKQQQQVYYDNAFRAYLDGASVVINHVDKQSPPINLLCQALGESFPHAFANMYLTPPNSQAVHPHSDDRDVLLLQVWGKKHWKVYSSPQVLPYTDEQVGKNGKRLTPEEMGPLTLDCMVEQGDVLYIPRGFVHEAHAQGTGSLHLTVAIPTQDFTWAVAALDAVKMKLRAPEMATWRRCVPLRLLPGHESEEETRGWRDELARLMADALSDMSVESVRHVLDQRMTRHRMRQREAPLPQNRDGARVRYKEGLLLISHLRVVRGVRYTLVEPETAALGPLHAPGMVQPRGGGVKVGETSVEMGRAGGGMHEDADTAGQKVQDRTGDYADKKTDNAAACRSEDNGGWILAIFQDASGKRMQWRLQASWAKALHFCFSAPMVQVQNIPLQDDVSKCFFAVLVMHLGVVEARRLPPPPRVSDHESGPL